jgi:hypothetical protein
MGGGGEYFIQVWGHNDKKAKEETRFHNFVTLREYVTAFKKAGAAGVPTDNILMVHLPSQASDDEKRQIIALGARLI